MRFTKMHGAGNDFVLVDGFRGELPLALPDLARRLCDRRLGVGGDGLIAVEPGADADFHMRVFNADGSEAETCGNGLRCAFKYLRDRDRIRGDRAVARTVAGRFELRLVATGETVEAIGVEMGRPRLDPRPGEAAGSSSASVPLTVEGRRFEAVCVWMGNPHAVVFLNGSVADFEVERYGPAIEHHPFFPDRTNVEFVQPLGRREVNQRTWERGSGETLACGSGACATVVGGCLTGRLEAEVDVHLRGGDLRIHWPGEGRPVHMVGPAVEVFEGRWIGEGAPDA